MKSLIKLSPINKKGLNFIKNNGEFHTAKIKDNKAILRDKNNKKVVIKLKDKRFIYEDLSKKANILGNRNIPESSYIDYFE